MTNRVGLSKFWRVLTQFLVLAAASLPAAAPLALESWVPKAPLPYPVGWASSATTDDGTIYVLGGDPTDSAGGIYAGTPTVQKYDPVQDAWDLTVAPLPVPRGGAAAASLDGVIYLAGGHDSASPFTIFDTVLAYDPRTGVSRNAGNMTKPVQWAEAAILDGQMYVVGGWNYDTPQFPLDSMERIDLATGVSTAIPLPGPMGAGAVIPVEMPNPPFGTSKRLFIMGGYGADGLITDGCTTYDPDSGQFSRIAPMPYRASTKAAGILGGRLYVIATHYDWVAYPEYPTFNALLAYDIASDTWIEVSRTPCYRDGPEAKIVGNVLYVIGGYAQNAPPGLNEALNVNASPPVTTVSYSPTPGQGGWFTSPVTITLSATDPDGSAIALTEYDLNDGNGWIPYSGPFTIANETVTILDYRSVDDARSVEPYQRTAVLIDATAPVAAITSPSNGATLPLARVTIEGTAWDGWGSTSGVSEVLVNVNFEPWGLAGGTTSWTRYWIPPADGTYTIRSLAVDVAGNAVAEADAASVTVTIDGTAPAFVGSAPANLDTGVPLNAAIALTFSEDIQASPLVNSIAVVDTSLRTKPLIPHAVSVVDDRLVITPAAPGLPKHSTIQVTVPAGVAVDRAGNPSIGVAPFTFETAKK